MVDIVKQIITDWHVIVITVGVVLYLNIVCYVASYKKRNVHSVVVKKAPVKKAAPEETAEPQSEENSEEAAE
ncbi:MAG: hypothetical protein K6F69_03345 [Treponema sp.]|nr:hypothetical protein [Treponema sp.]